MNDADRELHLRDVLAFWLGMLAHWRATRSEAPPERLLDAVRWAEERLRRCAREPASPARASLTDPARFRGG